jgi:ATP-binding cassette subfamily F protein 3
MCGSLDATKGSCVRQAKLRFSFFSQHHLDSLDMSVSSVEYLMKTFPGKNEEEVRRHLGMFGISGSTGLQQIQTLSGGQKSRVVFAMMSLMKPHILILDEPTNHLDMDTIDALVNALKSFPGGVVAVSHDSRFVEAICDTLWVCQNQRLLRYDGGIRDYKKKVIKEAYS